MARCPRCRAKQDYSALLVLSGRRKFACKQCGAHLQVNNRRLIPYLILVNAIAVVLGMAMVASREYATMLGALLVWVLIAWAVYPLVVSFSLPADDRATPRR